MSLKNQYFNSKIWPVFLLIPQLSVSIIFFLVPAFSALKSAFYYGDAFGLHKSFAGFANFYAIFSNHHYLNSILATLIFSFSVTLLALSAGLFLAVLSDRVVKGQQLYKTLLIWPYAVAPAVAGILWRFIFDPAVGLIPYLAQYFHRHWDFNLNSHEALTVIVLASVWQQFSYNFIFFLAGLNAIPQSLYEAAALDGAGPIRRFWTITFPLLSPTSFFLCITNLTYSFFDTFGIIDTITQGGPQESTAILVYKVYHDGFVGLDLGASSAQSVILMIIIILLTLLQFRYIERKVHY